MAVLEARDLRYDVAGTRVLDGVDIEVAAGEKVAVVGPSGSGKTTLLALLGGLAAPTGGEVRIDGLPLTGLTGPARGVSVVLQGYGLVSLLTAAENVEIAALAMGAHASQTRASAVESLGAVGLAAHADQLVDELSGGQQQRVAVARALIQKPRILLADEPTAELDAKMRSFVLSRLLEVVESGSAIVLATHDPEVAARCDRVFELHRAEADPGGARRGT